MPAEGGATWMGIVGRIFWQDDKFNLQKFHAQSMETTERTKSVALIRRIAIKLYLSNSSLRSSCGSLAQAPLLYRGKLRRKFCCRRA